MPEEDMTDRRDIYKASGKKGKGDDALAKVDLTMAEARARTWRNSVGFTSLMLLMLALASWFIFSQEQEAEEISEEKPLPTAALLPLEGGATSSAPELGLPELDALVPSAGGGGTPMEATAPDPEKAAAAMEQMRMADHYLRAREWDTAERHARQALKIWPNMNAALRMIGVIYTQRGQFDQAIAVLNKALRTNPFSAETYNTLASAYMHSGDMVKAEELLIHALELRPDYPDARFNLGMLYLAIGQYESAILYLEEAVQYMPNHAPVRNNLAVALFRVGQYEEARRHLQYLVDRFPEGAEPYFNMAITYVLEEDFQEALEWIQRGAQYCSPVLLQQYLADTDFDPLRGHPQFQSILRDVFPDLPDQPDA